MTQHWPTADEQRAAELEQERAAQSQAVLARLRKQRRFFREGIERIKQKPARAGYIFGWLVLIDECATAVDADEVRFVKDLALYRNYLHRAFWTRGEFNAAESDGGIDAQRYASDYGRVEYCKASFDAYDLVAEALKRR